MAAPSCQPLPYSAARVINTAPPASAAVAPRPWVSALASSSRLSRRLMVDTMESRWVNGIDHAMRRRIGDVARTRFQPRPCDRRSASGLGVGLFARGQELHV